MRNICARLGALGLKLGAQGVNPDEVVAVGAAIQGGVLKGDVKVTRRARWCYTGGTNIFV